MAAADDGGVMDPIECACSHCGRVFLWRPLRHTLYDGYCGLKCSQAAATKTDLDAQLVKAYDAVPHADATDRVAAGFDVTREAVIAAVRKSIERGGE